MVIKSLDKSSRRKRVELCLESVGLGHRMNYSPAKLSGGERQRVAIARALVNKPKFILADEPTGNLDSEATENIMQLLHNVNQSGTTVIMVTHDIETTKDTRILKIKDGAIEDSKNRYTEPNSISTPYPI